MLRLLQNWIGKPLDFFYFLLISRYTHMENSAMEKFPIACDAKMEDSPEESSWTFYIQAFICENDDQISYLSSEYESPSLVSDAASSAVKKLRYNCTEGIEFSSGRSNRNRSVRKQNWCKKQKTELPAMDYDLEDTASSPVNSPKISYINPFRNEKEKSKADVSEVKRNTFAKGGVYNVERDTDYTDLKKRTCN
ncbi:UNVERIFIED_CONTAM: hypothetical protein Sangu_2398900 [Sesamum angustifolium]|uniref:Uncharacterized protein n=1 Tax=Sesamum angustifolium TaxID=2727405 RepID=A0AAW2KVM4_9LAMI